MPEQGSQDAPKLFRVARQNLPPASAVLVLLGAACVAGGVWWIYPPAGLITAGAALILLGWPA